MSRIIGETINLDELMLVPQWTTLESRKLVSLERTFQFYHSPRIWTGIPIMAANMVPIGSFKMSEALSEYKMITCLHKYHNVHELSTIIPNEKYLPYIWISIGKNQDDIAKIQQFSDIVGFTPNLVIDVPNGYLESYIKFCSDVRKSFPESIICAGNICTHEMVSNYIINGGVDICKLQIGVGSACRTRLMTGIGYGSYSCIDECSFAAHGLKSDDKRLGLVCSDGGLKYPGDFAKGFCAGADFLCSGSFFCGTDECEADWVEENGQKYMIYYGMSTHYAQEKHANGKKEYRASEGDILKIPHKGSVDNLVQELLGGLRSTATYIGASSLKEFSRCAKFVKTSKIHDNLNSGIFKNGV